MAALEPKTVRDYLACLYAADIIEPNGQDTHGTRLYTLIDDRGSEAPRVDKDGKPVTQGLGREQMWRTMRMLSHDFTSRDLAIAASTEEIAVHEVDCRCYVQALAKAGYLLIVQPGRAAKLAKYRFVKSKYTGPKPPQIQRTKCVFDPNLGQIVWHEGFEE